MATEKPKKKFTFPTAFTILFILLVLIAAATWIVPAGSYDYNADGEPIPGTYHQVTANPQKLLSSALKGPINGMYGIEDDTGNVDVWSYGELIGAIDVAMFVMIIGGFLVVTAFQAANGLVNLVTPTAAEVMGGLGMEPGESFPGRCRSY